jgi:predicted MFS family arabinose efflux permease
MRYTKTALLIFGLGLIIGLVVVVSEFSEWERTAAAVMALGLVALPAALFADGRGTAAVAWIAAWFRRGKTRRKSKPASRRKKPAHPTARGPRRKPG